MPAIVDNEPIELVDQFGQCFAQAVAMANLLFEVDADLAIRDSAWAIRTLGERAAALLEKLLRPNRS